MRLSAYEAPVRGTFLLEDEDKAKIIVRLLTPGEINDINAEATNWEFRQGKKKSVDPVFQYHQQVERRLKYMKCLDGWEGIWADDAKKTPLAVTDENKTKLANQVPGFQELVLECLVKLEEQNTSQEARLLKN